MEDTSELDKIIDIGNFVRDVVEEWDLDQLDVSSVQEIKCLLADFYNKHKDKFEADYKLFMEDRDQRSKQWQT